MIKFLFDNQVTRANTSDDSILLYLRGTIIDAPAEFGDLVGKRVHLYQDQSPEKLSNLAGQLVYGLARSGGARKVEGGNEFTVLQGLMIDRIADEKETKAAQFDIVKASWVSEAKSEPRIIATRAAATQATPVEASF